MTPTFLIEIKRGDLVLRCFEDAQVFTTVEVDRKQARRLRAFLAGFEPEAPEVEDDEPSESELKAYLEQAQGIDLRSRKETR